MKVGNLHFTRFFGCFNIVMGANPCLCLGASLCMYTLAGAMLIGFAVAMPAGILKTIVWAIIVWDSLTFLFLCLSNPGVPKQIVDAARLIDQGIEQPNTV